MSNLQYISLFLFVWGAATLYVGATKASWAWDTAKLQALVRSFGEKGTQVFVLVWGTIAVTAGVVLLVTQ